MIPRTAEQLVELLDKLVTEGDLGYREAAGPPVDLDPVVEQLDDAGRELLARHEDESSRDATEWAGTHFRLGFALGRSGLLDALADAELAE